MTLRMAPVATWKGSSTGKSALHTVKGTQPHLPI